MEDDHSVMQLIDRDGKFNADGLDNFVKEVKLAECGISYAVVSIMGPQSSGKSTLLNRLFHTNFREMNAVEGRKQTTQGIWLAECVGIKPFTIVMDLEGNDGKERGQDIAFEKQAAVFACVISDILMINIHYTDIGLENAGNKPLLRTIFEVMLQSMGPRRQTTLMFIIRDLEETPLSKLRNDLLDDTHKIWNEVPKPSDREHTKLEDAFRVEVFGLPHYRYAKDKFTEDVDHLRRRFSNSISQGGLAGGCREDAVPGREFSSTSKEMWREVKNNQNLNLPKLKEMIANVRCEAIANNKVDRLRNNQDWLNLERRVKSATVPDFSEQLSSIIATCFNEYDLEVQYLEESIRTKKRKEILKRKALDVVYPAYKTMLEHLRHKEFEKFKKNMGEYSKKDELFKSVYTHSLAAMSEFDKGSKEYLVVIPKDPNNERKPIHERVLNVVLHKQSSSDVNWDASYIRMQLTNDIQGHATELFMGFFMGPDAKTEDAEKEYKEGWAEWLRRVLQIVASKFDWFQNS